MPFCSARSSSPRSTPSQVAGRLARRDRQRARAARRATNVDHACRRAPRRTAGPASAGRWCRARAAASRPTPSAAAPLAEALRGELHVPARERLERVGVRHQHLDRAPLLGETVQHGRGDERRVSRRAASPRARCEGARARDDAAATSTPATPGVNRPLAVSDREAARRRPRGTRATSTPSRSPSSRSAPCPVAEDGVVAPAEAARAALERAADHLQAGGGLDRAARLRDDVHAASSAGRSFRGARRACPGRRCRRSARAGRAASATGSALCSGCASARNSTSAPSAEPPIPTCTRSLDVGGGASARSLAASARYSAPRRQHAQEAGRRAVAEQLGDDARERRERRVELALREAGARRERRSERRRRARGGAPRPASSPSPSPASSPSRAAPPRAPW